MRATVARYAIASTAALGLAVSAAIHARLALPFDGNRGAWLGQGDLFRIQAALDALAAVAIVVLPRLLPALAAALIAAAGTALLVFTVFLPLDLTAVGLPVLFEPVWYADKATALAAQLVAVAAAAVLVAWRLRAPRPVPLRETR
ncbi:MAG: integral rane protein [Naasia sp.]|nr:integral rane protein [Naasia sp.]